MSMQQWSEKLFDEPSVEKVSSATSSDDFEDVAEDALSFEMGVQQLEKIVKALEQKDIALEKALSLFKDGVGLVQYCSRVLDQAEKQMEILLEGPDGQLQVAPASFPMEG